MKTIVSLTSFPAAIPFAAGAIGSILNGSVRPDRIVLYLTAAQFPGGAIPAELQALERENARFEVRFCDENIRSYTKLIPALRDFPDDIIITVDDDIRYDRKMVELLLRHHAKYPGAIVGHRIRRIEEAAGQVEPYSTWKVYKRYRYFLRDIRPGFRNLQTGVGGVLYPPRSLAEEMLDPALFRAMAPTVDDVWFWAAAVARGTRVAPVPFGCWNVSRSMLDKPEAISLKKTNLFSGVDVNRTVLESILEKYPVVNRRFYDEG